MKKLLQIWSVIVVVCLCVHLFLLEGKFRDMSDRIRLLEVEVEVMNKLGDTITNKMHCLETGGVWLRAADGCFYDSTSTFVKSGDAYRK